MLISLFTQFGALNSRPIFEGFAEGCRQLGFKVVENDINAEIFVIWSVLWHGRMKNNQEIWNLAKKTGKKIIVLEVGGLVRGKTWRVGLGHVNNLGNFWKTENFDFERPKKLGISLLPHQKTGKNILICGQHTKSEQWKCRPDPVTWLINLVNEIRIHTDRSIVFRPHPRDTEWTQNLPDLGIKIQNPQKIHGTYDDFDHERDFLSAWCVINPSSNTGIQAAIAGIPVFCDTDSLAYPVSNKNFENIISPTLPERENWLVRVCHTEWLVEEIRQGLPLARIL